MPPISRPRHLIHPTRSFLASQISKISGLCFSICLLLAWGVFFLEGRSCEVWSCIPVANFCGTLYMPLRLMVFCFCHHVFQGFAVVDMGTTGVATIRELARSVNASGAEHRVWSRAKEHALGEQGRGRGTRKLVGQTETISFMGNRKRLLFLRHLLVMELNSLIGIILCFVGRYVSETRIISDFSTVHELPHFSPINIYILSEFLFQKNICLTCVLFSDWSRREVWLATRSWIRLRRLVLR